MLEHICRSKQKQGQYEVDPLHTVISPSLLSDSIEPNKDHIFDVLPNEVYGHYIHKLSTVNLKTEKH